MARMIQRLRAIPPLVPACLWLMLLAAYILAGLPLVPFHGDESTVIFTSKDYAYLFIDRDWGRIAYEAAPADPEKATEQDLRLLNGTLTRYLMGFTWQLAGFSAADINAQWDWGADWNYNQSAGHAPSAALLHTLRLTAALLLVLGLLAIFAIGWQLGGPWIACMASLYYALNPPLLLNGRRAMMEGAFIAFSLLTVLAGITFLKRPSLWRAMLLGVAAGLALASKHTALFTVAAVYAIALGYLIAQTIRSREDDASDAEFVLLPYLVLAMAFTGGVFLLLNPAWWSDPLARVLEVLDRRQDLLGGQTAAFGGYAGLGEQLVGFLRQVFMAQPQFFEVQAWQVWISDPITAYQASPWRGLPIGGSVAGAVILCGMMALGFWALLRGGAERAAARWMVTLWALAMLGTTALLTPVEWGRYYLPAYPAVGLTAAVGLVWSVRRLWSVRPRRYPIPESAPLPGFDGVPLPFEDSPKDDNR
jgi:uncharacterized protein YjeT (DUF2065 family)